MAKNKTLADYMALDYPIELQSDRDQGGYFARHPDLSGCTAEGETADEAVENLALSRELWIEARLDSGFPVPEPPETEYGGRVSLRIPRGLHASLARASTRQGMSLNQLLTSILSEWAGGISVEHHVEEKLRDIMKSASRISYAITVTAKADTGPSFEKATKPGSGASYAKAN